MFRPLLSAAALVILLVAALPSAAGAGVSLDNEIVASITNGATPVVPGTTATDTLTVTNEGPDAAQPEVAPTFTQGTVGNWTCVVSGPGSGGDCGAASGSGAINVVASLPPGRTATYTIPLIVPSAASAASRRRSTSP